MSAEQSFTVVVVPLFIGLQSAFSGVFLRVGHAKLREYRRFRTEAVRTTGTVVDIEEQVPRHPGTAPGKTLYWTILEYPARDGTLVRARSDATTGLRPTLGEATEIACFPTRPGRVQIVRQRSALPLFAVAALAIPVAYLRVVLAVLPAALIAVSLVFHGLGYLGAARVLGPRASGGG